MLRVQDDSSRQRLPRSATAFLTVVLALAGVGISALRGPAQQNTDVRADAQETTVDNLSRPAPFDLAYVNPDAHGVLALRPAAFLRRTSMGVFASLAKGQLASILCELKIPQDAAPSLEMIEQMIGEAQLIRNEKAPKGQRDLFLFGLNMIRTKKDFDWKKFTLALMPDAEKVRYRGKTYFKGKLEATGLKLDLCYFLPDGHTIVFHQEKTMRRVLDNLVEERALPWAGDWRRVQRGLAAMAFDTVWLRRIGKGNYLGLAPVFERTANFVVGVDLNNLFTAQAFGGCPDEKSAETLIEWMRTTLAESNAILDQEEPDRQNPIADRLARDLFKQARVAQHGTKISLHTQTNITIADLEKMLLSSGFFSK